MAALQYAQENLRIARLNHDALLANDDSSGLANASSQLLSAEQAVRLRAVPLALDGSDLYIFVHDHSTLESLTDLDEHELVDFSGNHSVLVHGGRPAAVVAAVGD